MKAFYLFLLLSLAASCRTHSDPSVGEAALMDVDRSFSELSVSEGMTKAFLQYCATDAVMLRENSMPVQGKESISSLLEGNDDSGFTLSWEPRFAKVAGSGEIGYTYGLYALRPAAADTVLRGTYVSVWVKENGQWKWILDSGNAGLGE